MSVASKAPAEILCEIFLLLCIEPIYLHELQNKKHFHQFPWAVGQVSRHWRGAFLSYPALWSTLSLRFEDGFRDSWPRTGAAYVTEMNRRTEIFLKRSGKWPLTLEFRVPSNTSESVCMTIWAMLLSCSDRWKEMELDIKYEPMVDGLVKRKKEMSVLESLAIVVHHPQHHKYGTAFEMVPRLTKLSLESDGNARARGMLASWTFPWAQLTQLKIDRCELGANFATCNAFRTFLLQFLNVEELHICLFPFEIDSDVDSGVINCPPVRFPRLKSLRFLLYTSRILSFFEAPLLEHLSVCDSYDDKDQEDHNQEFTSFVHRSSCRIRCLVLEDCTTDVTLGIIGALPHVEELHLSEVTEPEAGDAPYIVWYIAYPGHRCLPNLRSLKLHCCPEYFYNVIETTSLLFSERNTQMEPKTAGPSIVPLERLSVTVDWTGCGCGRCSSFERSSKAMAKTLNYTRVLPSFSVISLNNDQWTRTLTVCASATGVLINFTICYPEDLDAYEYYVDESRKHQDILTGRLSY